MHSEVLVCASGRALVDVELRFLQLNKRQLFAVNNGERIPVQSLEVYGSTIESCEQSEEKRVNLNIGVVDGQSSQEGFCFPGFSKSEPTNYAGEEVESEIQESAEEIRGTVALSCMRLAPDTFRLTIEVTNGSTLPPTSITRDDALLRSMLSAHLILSLEGGEFISLLDPPERLSQAVKDCKNLGNFPVLMGNEGERDMMLCSPILLYDYPQIAPESAGDFFDATEMDEMLTLRVMTLTDAEKDEVRSGDAHARTLLERTEQTVREQLQRTHGIIRNLHDAGGRA